MVWRFLEPVTVFDANGLILVTANVVAYHPRVRRGILFLVKLPKNGRQAVVMVGLASMVTGWISWGLGLISELS